MQGDGVQMLQSIQHTVWKSVDFSSWITKPEGVWACENALNLEDIDSCLQIFNTSFRYISNIGL